MHGVYAEKRATTSQPSIDHFNGACLPHLPLFVLSQFDDDFYEFRCSIKELERRLGAVVSLAFDDCATVYGRFKLLDSFEGLLERPIIQVHTLPNVCEVFQVADFDDNGVLKVRCS